MTSGTIDFELASVPLLATYSYTPGEPEVAPAFAHGGLPGHPPSFVLESCTLVSESDPVDLLAFAEALGPKAVEALEEAALKAAGGWEAFE